MQVIPVILSGGIGSRLWPLSRVAAPKQLQSLAGSLTMIQATAMRLTGAIPAGVTDPIVVANHRHVPMILTQLAEAGVSPLAIIAEPVGRNTAPAVAAAALIAPPGGVLVILPADSLISDLDAFRRAVAAAVEEAGTGSLVLLGVIPRNPETGYGYIRRGSPAGAAFVVEQFVEKPDLATATGYVADGGYLWNSGMFVFTREAGLEAFDLHAPEVLEAVSRSLPGPVHGLISLSDSFAAAASISFDKAVMEKAEQRRVVPLDTGWSDVGSWATLWEVEPHDQDGNVTRGDVVAMDVHGSYLRSEGPLVAAVGLDNIVVVVTADAVLIAARDRVQEVKALVERLAGRFET